jgi:hypothetical protein
MVKSDKKIMLKAFYWLGKCTLDAFTTLPDSCTQNPHNGKVTLHLQKAWKINA